MKINTTKVEYTELSNCSKKQLIKAYEDFIYEQRVNVCFSILMTALITGALVFHIFHINGFSKERAISDEFFRLSNKCIDTIPISSDHFLHDMRRCDVIFKTMIREKR